MLDFSFSIESDVEEALERFQEAISELDGMTFEVEAGRPEGVPVAHRGGERSKGGQTGTVTVYEVPSSAEPFGHSTISVGGDTAVGLEPDSDLAAGAGLAEDVMSGGLPLEYLVTRGMAHPVSGHVERDFGSPKEQVTLHVTPEQAARMEAFIAAAWKHPQSYDVLYHNCAEWVEEVLRAGGIRAPNSVFPGGLVEDLKERFPK